MSSNGQGPIAPGATIGFLGGGQLGRMTALAARAMGYRIHVLDPDEQCSAAPVADRVVTAAFDDVAAARELARHCDVITLEIEQIATSVIEAASAYAPTRPAAALIHVVQDRARQKLWLQSNNFPVGPYQLVQRSEDIAVAIDAYGDCFIKSCHGGYDGRSQARTKDPAKSDEVWRDLGGREAVAEQALELAGEFSVMVARRPSGEMSLFPLALNHHERHALAWSMTPVTLPKPIMDHASDIGRGIATAIELEGLLAVEFFLTMTGEILVNELAPRPHNSFHATERACATSQFEQLTRAVCDLPLGDTRVIKPTAIVNLFGDLWRAGAAPDFGSALAVPGVRLHLYGKHGARTGRKMGHLSAIGGSATDALRSAREAAARIGAITEPMPVSLESFGVKI